MPRYLDDRKPYLWGRSSVVFIFCVYLLATKYPLKHPAITQRLHDDVLSWFGVKERNTTNKIVNVSPSYSTSISVPRELFFVTNSLITAIHI